MQFPIITPELYLLEHPEYQGTFTEGLVRDILQRDPSLTKSNVDAYLRRIGKPSSHLQPLMPQTSVPGRIPDGALDATHARSLMDSVPISSRTFGARPAPPTVGPTVASATSPKTPRAAAPTETLLTELTDSTTTPTTPTTGTAGAPVAPTTTPATVPTATVAPKAKPGTATAPGPTGSVSGTGAGASAATAAAAGAADDVAAAAAKTGPRIFAPGLTDKIKAGAGNLMNPEFDYSLGKGVSGWGQNLGTYATVANGLMQGMSAMQGLSDNADAATQTDDLTSSVLTAAMGNPMLTYDLSADQQKLLNDLRSGSYDSRAGLSDIDVMGALGDVGMGVLTGAAGGVPGMIVGGLGGLFNSGISDLGNAQARKNAELQALYSALQESNSNYKEQRRQRMLSRY